MIRGRKPKPTALRRADGNPGKRGFNADEPVPPDGLPDCPSHLCMDAREEWDRLAGTLHAMGVLTLVDRAVMAAYCQSWGRWVEAEEKLKVTPTLLKSPSGYVQQSPWLSIANKQLELMSRYMTELGLTPAARSRIVALRDADTDPVNEIKFVVVYEGDDGQRYERPIDNSGPPKLYKPEDTPEDQRPPMILDGRL
jgi:P27 family predicted phage terminase small subunit